MGAQRRGRLALVVEVPLALTRSMLRITEPLLHWTESSPCAPRATSRRLDGHGLSPNARQRAEHSVRASPRPEGSLSYGRSRSRLTAKHPRDRH